MTRMNTDPNQSARTFIVSTPEDVEKKHTLHLTLLPVR
jgi:hypothetical protein